MKRVVPRDLMRAEVLTWERRVAEAERELVSKPLLSRPGVLLQLWSARRILRNLQAIIRAEDAEDDAAARRAGHDGPWVG